MLGPHTHAYTWMYVYGLCVCCKCVLPYVHMYACMYYRSLCSLYAGQPLLCRCLGLFLTHNNTHTHAHPYTRINMYAIVKQRVREAENRVIHGHIEEKCSWEKAFSFCLLTIGVFSRTHPNIHICYKYSWVCVCVCAALVLSAYTCYASYSKAWAPCMSARLPVCSSHSPFLVVCFLTDRRIFSFPVSLSFSYAACVFFFIFCNVWFMYAFACVLVLPSFHPRLLETICIILYNFPYTT